MATLVPFSRYWLPISENPEHYPLNSNPSARRCIWRCRFPGGVLKFSNSKQSRRASALKFFVQWHQDHAEKSFLPCGVKQVVGLKARSRVNSERDKDRFGRMLLKDLLKWRGSSRSFVSIWLLVWGFLCLNRPGQHPAWPPAFPSKGPLSTRRRPQTMDTQQPSNRRFYPRL